MVIQVNRNQAPSGGFSKKKIFRKVLTRTLDGSKTKVSVINNRQIILVEPTVDSDPNRIVDGSINKTSIYIMNHTHEHYIDNRKADKSLNLLKDMSFHDFIHKYGQDTFQECLRELIQDDCVTESTVNTYSGHIDIGENGKLHGELPVHIYNTFYNLGFSHSNFDTSADFDVFHNVSNVIQAISGIKDKNYRPKDPFPEYFSMEEQMSFTGSDLPFSQYMNQHHIYSVPLNRILTDDTVMIKMKIDNRGLFEFKTDFQYDTTSMGVTLVGYIKKAMEQFGFTKGAFMLDYVNGPKISMLHRNMDHLYWKKSKDSDVTFITDNAFYNFSRYSFMNNLTTIYEEEFIPSFESCPCVMFIHIDELKCNIRFKPLSGYLQAHNVDVESETINSEILQSIKYLR